ncbi:MAG: putative signal peptide protein [Herbaspirillum sp.]|nr:putative signal peptide protein [Herbaspirillum sp.]
MPDSTADDPDLALAQSMQTGDGRRARRRTICTALGLLGAGLGPLPSYGAAVRPLVPSSSPSSSPPKASAPESVNWSRIRDSVADASRPSLGWLGPTEGPQAAKGKTIALWADNLRDGGVLGVAVGVREAIRQIGWQVRLFHSDGTAAGMRESLLNAIAAEPDGIVVLGGDHRAMAAQLKPAATRGVNIVGWHVAPYPGRLAGDPIAVNLSPDPLEVARITALAALLPTRGAVGVVILTDNSLELGRVKSEQMAAVIRASGGTLLETFDLRMAAVPRQMASATNTLLGRYSTQWTHALAINDIYFDYALPQLTSQGISSSELSLLSAGDGSASAILRIMAGNFQTSTIAEPLNLHGWQLVDELNRLFAGDAPSGFIAPAHLLTSANIAYDGGPRMMFDPENGYRYNYRQIWGRT